MNVLTSDTVAVPDSSFPFSNELEGLLEPQSSPEDCAAAIGLKLASWQGDDGSNFYLPPYGPDYCGLDVDWMCQNTLLPTPQDQETDVGLLLHPPVTYTSSNTFPSVLTPDSSHPSTPTSQYQSDVLNILFNPDAQLSQSPDILPQFDGHSPLSSPASYHPSPATYTPTSAGYDFTSTSYDPTPAGTFLPSPLPPSQESSPEATSYYAMPQADSPSSPCCTVDTKAEGIRDLLAKSTPSPTGSDLHKRDAAVLTDPSEGVVKGKRRKLSKVAKKERKKEQNKQAALRYRQRKRGEADTVESKREELEAVNRDLKSKVNSLTAEINYLKKLWGEIEAVRGRSLDEQSQTVVVV